MVSSFCIALMHQRCEAAEVRYGQFASTHEALGVAVEEFDELRDAIRANDLVAIRDEALDVAAVMLRLASACDDEHRYDVQTAFGRRSVK